MEAKKIAKLGLGAAMVAALIYIGNFSRAITEISRMSVPVYGAASAVFMAGIVIGGFRWFLFNRLLEEKVTASDSMKVYFLNYSLSTVFIGNLAEAGRYKIQERYCDVRNKYSVTGAVAVEKLLDLVSVLTVIAVSTGFVYSSVSRLLAFPGLATVKSFIYRALGEGSRVLTEMKNNPGSSLSIVTLSLAIWWLEAVAFYLIAVSLGLELGFFQAAITTSVMSLASALPITPSGLGTTESAGYALLSVFGIGSGAALAIVAGQRFLGVILSSIPGVIVYFSDYTAS